MPLLMIFLHFLSLVEGYAFLSSPLLSMRFDGFRAAVDA